MRPVKFGQMWSWAKCGHYRKNSTTYKTRNAVVNVAFCLLLCGRCCFPASFRVVQAFFFHPLLGWWWSFSSRFPFCGAYFFPVVPSSLSFGWCCGGVSLQLLENGVVYSSSSVLVMVLLLSLLRVQHIHIVNFRWIQTKKGRGGNQCQTTKRRRTTTPLLLLSSILLGVWCCFPPLGGCCLLHPSHGAPVTYNLQFTTYRKNNGKKHVHLVFDAWNRYLHLADNVSEERFCWRRMLPDSVQQSGVCSDIRKVNMNSNTISTETIPRCDFPCQMIVTRMTELLALRNC